LNLPYLHRLKPLEIPFQHEGGLDKVFGIKEIAQRRRRRDNSASVRRLASNLVRPGNRTQVIAGVHKILILILALVNVRPKISTVQFF
jgi:hypothetical protein